MGLWLLFFLFIIGIWVYMIIKFRQKEKLNECQLKAKKIENIRLKEELLKIKSGKDKLKDNLEKYQKENESSYCFDFFMVVDNRIVYTL